MNNIKCANCKKEIQFSEAKECMDRERVIMEKWILILTVGLPRSGKTTWARAQNVPIVNPDSIRLAIHGQRFLEFAEPLIWAVAKIMVYALFLAGNSMVIVDATNGTNKRRDFWKDKKWCIEYKIINTPKEECIRRALELNDNEIVPVIEKMSNEYEPIN